jgi:cytochrome c553
MTMNRLLVATAAGGAVAALALASIAPAQSQGVAHMPDSKRGAVIVVQGTTAGAPACAQCHADNGVSDSSGAFPRLAAQSGYYLAKQLHDFTSGVRDNAVMSPIAKALSSDEMADVAAYYAAQQAIFLPLAKPDPALIKEGEQLAKVGNAARGIQACDNCHGPQGAGEPPAIPYLAGQYASYLSTELRQWRHGFRKSSPSGMAVVAKDLDDKEIAAVAAYYQQVQASLEAADTSTSR